MDDHERFFAAYQKFRESAVYRDQDASVLDSLDPVWERRLRPQLPSSPDARILDLGCGVGTVVRWLHSEGFGRAEGVDVSREQVELGTKLGIGNLRHGDLREVLSGNEGAFDLVLARDVLEHFSKAEILQILELVYRSLRKGGRFVVQVPNAQGLFFGSVFYADFTHQTAFTERSVRQVLESTGFHEVACSPCEPVVHGVRSGLRWALWRLLSLAIRLAQLIEAGHARGYYTRNLIAVAERK